MMIELNHTIVCRYWTDLHAKNSCSRTCLMFGLRIGFFSKQRAMNSFASSDIGASFEKKIGSSTIFERSDLLRI